MTSTRWAAIALTLALAGCQPGIDQQAGNNQARQDSPAASADLADALVEAARVQASLARNDRTTANTAIRQLRDELAAAKAAAPLDVQSRINALDQVAIETQQAIEAESPEASQRAERLLDETQLALAGGEPGQAPTGGGAGRSGHMDGEPHMLEPGGMGPAPGAPMDSPAQPNQPVEPQQPVQPGGNTGAP
ncbi:hypothetical protein D3C72_534900 [compost metagenome]